MIEDIFKSAINLKKIKRQGWIDKLSLKNPESVADHSYSMAIMGMMVVLDCKEIIALTNLIPESYLMEQ